MMSIASHPILGDGTLPAHDFIPPGTEWWSVWYYTPEIVIPLGLATFLYLRGLRNWQHRSREHPWWKTAFYLTGMAILALSLLSPLSALSLHHLTFHMIQHELIMMVAIPLILLGAPTTPTLRGMPPWMRKGIVRPIAKQPVARFTYRFFTAPVVALVILTVVMWLWHLAPGWYDAVLENDRVHDLQHLSMAGAAVLFWWNVIDPKPLRSRIPHLARIVYIAASGGPKMFLAAIIVFAENPLYAHYIGTREFLPLTAMEDQQLGGLIMWIPGIAIMVLASGIVFAVWARRDAIAEEQRQAEADAEAAAQREANQAAS